MVIGFEMIKPIYLEDLEFKDIFFKCQQGPKGQFHVTRGFPFKANRLCIPKTPLRQMLVKEVHEGALGGNFGIQKSLDMLA